MREYVSVKTTIELPYITFRRVKALAAARGITMRRFFRDAVEQQFRRRGAPAPVGKIRAAALQNRRGWQDSAALPTSLTNTASSSIPSRTSSNAALRLAPDDIR